MVKASDSRPRKINNKKKLNVILFKTGNVYNKKLF